MNEPIGLHGGRDDRDLMTCPRIRGPEFVVHAARVQMSLYRTRAACATEIAPGPVPEFVVHAARVKISLYRTRAACATESVCEGRLAYFGCEPMTPSSGLLAVAYSRRGMRPER